MSRDVSAEMIDVSDLPKGWRLKPLKQVTRPSKVKVDPRQCPDKPYLSLEHIESETTKILGRGTASDVRSTKAVFKAGDVLYGRLRPYLNKVARPDFDGVASTDILVFPPQQELDQRYLLRFLNSTTVVDHAHHHSMGLQMPRIGFEVLGDIPIPLPPIDVQRQIADILEDLIDQVDSAKDRLASIPALLKKFRQSVLAAACSGQLTADIAEGESPWHLTSVKDHTELTVGFAFSSKRFVSSGIRLLRGENIEPGRARWIDTRYWDQSDVKAYQHLMLEAGDLVLAMDRPIISTGLKLAKIEQSDLPALLVQRVSRLRAKEGLLQQFLGLRLFCQDFMQHLTDGETGSHLPHVSGKTIQAFEFELPSMREQAEIVRRVESLFALADSIESRLADATAQVERTTQAILAKAFRGELDIDLSELPEPKRVTTSTDAPFTHEQSTKQAVITGKMKTSLKEIVQTSNQSRFDPEQLRTLFSGDYDSFRDELFALLSEPSPILRQHFDESTQRIQLVKE